MVTGIIIAVFVIAFFAFGIKIVPHRQAWIIERFGKYSRTLNSGFNIIIPIIDLVAYKQNLKEEIIDVQPQKCVTKDNIIVDVDGLFYMQVIDPVKASYGIVNYKFACAQLAQTTLRSEIGKLTLDKTFEERAIINMAICDAIDKASEPWGIKIYRYEIKTITPPKSIYDAMEMQMRAERIKRASVAEAEGAKLAQIALAEGQKQEKIALSEGEKLKNINEAEGKAKEIELVANATAKGLEIIAEAINKNGGSDAVNLQLADKYITEFGKLAKESNTMIIPSDLSNIAGFIKCVGTVLNK